MELSNYVIIYIYNYIIIVYIYIYTHTPFLRDYFGYLLPSLLSTSRLHLPSLAAVAFSTAKPDEALRPQAFRV